MKITKEHKFLSVWRFVSGSGMTAVALLYYGREQWPMFYLLLIGGLSWVYSAFKDYREVWEISKEGGEYLIHKNHKVVFGGQVTDLLAITNDSANYLIYPLKGRRIIFPKSSAQNCMEDLYQEYREKKIVEQVAAPDGE